MNKTLSYDYTKYIASIPNFPKEGVLFRDITPLLQNSQVLDAAVCDMLEPFRNENITKILGIEARGFLIGAPMAIERGVGFVPVRKTGKLPREVVRETYDLEYGTDCVEIHADAINENDCILLADDLLATGGTALATAKLIKKCGAKLVGMSFIIDLYNLGGKEKIQREFPDIQISSLTQLEG